MNLSIRAADTDDKKFLLDLNKLAYQSLVTEVFGVWDDAWQCRHFEEKWFRNGYQIIQGSNKPIGTIWLSDEQDHVRIHEFQILPAYQNRGIGSVIISQILSDAAKRNKTVKLQVLKGNRAQQLYERFGFFVYKENKTHRFMMFERSKQANPKNASRFDQAIAVEGF